MHSEQLSDGTIITLDDFSAMPEEEYTALYESLSEEDQATLNRLSLILETTSLDYL